MNIPTFNWANNFLGFSERIIELQLEQNARRTKQFKNQIVNSNAFIVSSIDSAANRYYGLAKLQTESIGRLSQQYLSIGEQAIKQLKPKGFFASLFS
ncbi:MAG: hypothetical protein ACREVA_12215 [Burkholderiales bacterium]